MKYSFSIARFFLFVSAFAIVLVTPSTLFPFIVGKYAFFRFCVFASAAFFFLGFLTNSEKGKMYLGRLEAVIKTPLGLALTGFLISTLISVIVGVQPAFSFWSNFERGEGGFQLLTLYVYYLLLVTLFTEKKDWRKILGYTLLTGLLVVVYGMFASGILVNQQQGFIGPKLTTVSDFRFQGTIGNPAYAAAYFVFLIAFAATFLEGKIKNILKSATSISAIICIIVFIIFFWLSATRGAFVGLFAALLAGMAYVGYSLPKFRKWLIVVAAACVVLLIVMVSFRNTTFVKNLPGGRLFDLSLTTHTLQTRTIMWQIALKGVADRPLFGWGPENFPYVFDKHFITSDYKPGSDFGVWFDRAHSVVFDTLATGGIVGLLTYLLVFVMYYIEFFKARIGKNENLLIESILFALPVAYFVQGLALFDVLSIYLNLFLMLALGSYYFYYWRLQKQEANS